MHAASFSTRGCGPTNHHETLMGTLETYSQAAKLVHAHRRSHAKIPQEIIFNYPVQGPIPAY